MSIFPSKLSYVQALTANDCTEQGRYHCSIEDAT